MDALLVEALKGGNVNNDKAGKAVKWVPLNANSKNDTAISALSPCRRRRRAKLLEWWQHGSTRDTTRSDEFLFVGIAREIRASATRLHRCELTE
jgi:hypothetical protein